MIYKNCNEAIPIPGPFTKEDEELLQASEDALIQIRQHMNTQSLHKVCEVIMSIGRLGNKYIDVQAPWTLKKTDIDRMKTVLYVLVEVIRRVAILIEPLVPASSTRLLDTMRCTPDMRTFQSISKNSMIPSGQIISLPTPIFPKIELIKKELV